MTDVDVASSSIAPRDRIGEMERRLTYLQRRICETEPGLATQDPLANKKAREEFHPLHAKWMAAKAQTRLDI